MRIDTGRVAAKSLLANKEIILLYVESPEDVRFWRNRLASQDLTCVDVKPASKIKGSNGKDEIISRIDCGDIVLGIRVLVAIDSDYDYLKGNRSNLYNSPFLFQTYAYSIESYNYYPGHALEACLNATNTSLTRRENYPIEEAFRRWSISNCDDFIKYIAGDKDAKKRLYSSLAQVEYNGLSHYEEDRSDLFPEELIEKGVRKHNIFLFVNGHKLENRIKYLVKGIVRAIISDEISNTQGTNASVTADLRKQYTNSLSCPFIELKALDKSSLPFMEKINEDLFNYKELAKDILS